jgi:hypothetical protein
MLVEFDTLPDTSRIWIYQSNRTFTLEESGKIKIMMNDFIQNWNNHGDGLKASSIIKYNQFIVLAVDEGYKSASGCSIDSSVHIIKKIEQAFQVNLFDRMQTAFKDNTTINTVSIANFQKYAKENKITANTIVFNNMIKTKAEFKSNWEVTANESWHARFLN